MNTRWQTSRSSNKNLFVCHVVDLLQVIGPVSARPMFGGYGIFLDSLMFALVADDVLYFKVDKHLLPQYTDKGLPAFSYRRQGKLCRLSYYQPPDEVFDDVDLMRRYGSQSFEAALRVAAGKV